MSTPSLLHITSADQLRAIAPLWDDLWWRSEFSAPTARAELLALWLETYAPNSRFTALVVEEQGRWTAALPLVHGRFHQVLSGAFLPTSGWVTPGGPLLLDANIHSEQTLDALVAGIRVLACSVFWLDNVELDAPRWRGFLAALDRAEMPSSIHRRYRVGRVAINDDWEAYRLRWSRHHRSNITRRSKRLAELGEVAQELLWDLQTDDVSSWVRRGFEIENSGWKRDQGTFVVQRGQLAYYLAQAEILARSGQLGLSFLRINERYIAFCYGYYAKGVYHTHKHGYDPEFTRFSPSQLLFSGLFEHVCRNPQYRAVDFAGELTDALSCWKPDVYDVGSIMIAPRRWTGRVATYAHKRWWPHIRRIRQTIQRSRHRVGGENGEVHEETDNRREIGQLRVSGGAEMILRAARRQVVRTAGLLGVPAIWQHVTGCRHLILMFHRLRPLGQPLDPFDTCPSHPVDTFRAILEYVANCFRVVTLRELVSQRGEQSPLAAITFDDGWRDNYDLAFPVLKELNLPATVFLTTGKVGSSEPFWQQTLGRLFRLAKQEDDPAIAAALRSVLAVPKPASLDANCYRRSVPEWKHLPAPQRQQRIRYLLDEGPEPLGGPRLFLNAEEIAEMRTEGIEFGSHTVHHELLNECQPEELLRELADSKAQVEALVQEPIDSIAYPNGNFTESVVHTARDMGYQIGCTTCHSRTGVRDDPLLLPRVEPEWDVATAYRSFDKLTFEWTAK